MLQKIKRLIISLLIVSVITGSTSAGAFGFTDVSKAGVQFQGTRERPVQAGSEADILSKYMKLCGMKLGKLYYALPESGMFNQETLTGIIKTVYPFLMSAVSWYEYIPGTADKVYYIELFFHTPDYAAEGVKRAEEITAQITNDTMGYMDKILAIHDYLVDNVEYDWDLYNSKSSDTKHAGYTAYGALVLGKAVCEGYSSAFAVMCHAAGIPAYMVIGKNRTGPHSWNLVYLHGSFYHVDVTGDDETKQQYRYFMLSEEEISKTHTVDSKASRTAILSLHSAGLPSAQLLHELGLMQGSGIGFDLDRSPSRYDAAVMLTRLLGKEAEALRRKNSHPFTDVPEWASPYIGYLYRNGLTTGAAEAEYAGTKAASINDYMTFILRSLGYSDQNGDFTWDTAVETAERLGIVAAGRYSSGSALTRGEMAEISIMALIAKISGGKSLLDGLVSAGVVSKERAAAVAAFLPSGT